MVYSKSIVFEEGNRINLEYKSSFFQKFQGLLGVRMLEKNKGIVLVGCKQIHTFGMRFPIDIVVLDKDCKVIDVVGGLKANKISPYYRRGHYIIELAVNSISRNLIGSKIKGLIS